MIRVKWAADWYKQASCGNHLLIGFPLSFRVALLKDQQISNGFEIFDQYTLLHKRLGVSAKSQS